MAEISLRIGNRDHRVACRDGSEDQLRRMAALIDARWPSANQASGGLSDERTMLFAALMLADALDEAERRPASGDDSPYLRRLADRLEDVAKALEHREQTP